MKLHRLCSNEPQRWFCQRGFGQNKNTGLKSTLHTWATNWHLNLARIDSSPFSLHFGARLIYTYLESWRLSVHINQTYFPKLSKYFFKRRPNVSERFAQVTHYCSVLKPHAAWGRYNGGQTLSAFDAICACLNNALQTEYGRNIREACSAYCEWPRDRNSTLETGKYLQIWSH